MADTVIDLLANSSIAW